MSSCGRTLKFSTATRKVTGSHGDQRTPTLLCGCGSSSTTILRSAHRQSLHHWPHLLRLLRVLEGSRSQSYRPWYGRMPEPFFERTCCNDLRILSAGAWQLFSFHRAEGAHPNRCPYPVRLWWTARKGRRGYHIIRHDNSRVGFGAVIPKVRILKVGKAGALGCPSSLGLGTYPSVHTQLIEHVIR